MKKMKKTIASVMMSVLMLGLLAGCAGKGNDKTNSSAGVQNYEDATIMVAAAASLKNAYTDELIPMFEERYPGITVECTFDGSGKLQTQIEEGLGADVFMSAATKQMNALVEEGFIESDSVVELLENKVVLIIPAGAEGEVTCFEDISKAEFIAIGDPESVPAGQYAKEIFENLGIWDELSSKLSLGTNVTEVLTWVSEASAEVGVVYATDAASTDAVTVICEAPEGSLATPVIYPVAVLSGSAHSVEAQMFVDFLQTEEAMAVFEKYGFSAY